MRWFVFGVLVVLTLPLVAFTAITPIYAMLLHGQALANRTATIAFGLDQAGLFLLAVTGSVCGFKISLPLLVHDFRAGGMVWTCVCLLIWLLSVAMSSSAMLLAAGQLLPAHMPDRTTIALMISWPVLDVISALLPIVLMGPHEQAEGPRNAPVSNVHTHETRRDPPRLDGSEREVVTFLNSIANGREVDGVDLLAVGQIRTTQRMLGEALGLSAATVNRVLRSLDMAGRIRLTTSTKGTSIRLM